MANVKIPYEPPRIIDLTSGEAHAQEDSSKKDSNKCAAGGSPGQHCSGGGTAYGGKCTSGSVASQSCWQGNVPKK